MTPTLSLNPGPTALLQKHLCNPPLPKLCLNTTKERKGRLLSETEKTSKRKYLATPRFRSRDLRVMSPARFRCAMLLSNDWLASQINKISSIMPLFIGFRKCGKSPVTSGTALFGVYHLIVELRDARHPAHLQRFSAAARGKIGTCDTIKL
jgi:hypothetical protein